MRGRVRLATLQDAHAIAEAHFRSRVAGYRGHEPDDWLDPSQLKRHLALWTHWLKEPSSAPSSTFVAEVDGRVVGFVGVAASRDPDDDPAKVGQVTAIYVDPCCWRQGVGRSLLDAALQALSARGFESASAWTYATTMRSRRFYEACGWTTDGVERPDPRGRAPNHIRYRRALSPLTQRARSDAPET